MLLLNISTNDFIYMFFVLFFMLVLTYYATKYIAKSYGTSGGRKTKMINVIDRMHLSKDSALVIVKVGEKVVLLGVTQQSINKVLDLDESEIFDDSVVEKTLDQMTFTEALKKNFSSNFVKEENKDFDER